MGFLAVYLCGLWLGNHDVIHGRSIGRFHDAIAWLDQIGMFLVLGLLVSPSRLPSVAGTALAITAVLVLVARPIGTIVALTPFRVPVRDQSVVAWVGLRGYADHPRDLPARRGAPRIANALRRRVLRRADLRARSGHDRRARARFLRTTSPAPPRPPSPLEAGRPLPDGTAMRELTIAPSTYADGRALLDLHLPERPLLVLIERGDTFVISIGATRLEAGDTITLLADDPTFTRTAHLLMNDDHSEGTPS